MAPPTARIILPRRPPQLVVLVSTLPLLRLLPRLPLPRQSGVDVVGDRLVWARMISIPATPTPTPIRQHVVAIRHGIVPLRCRLELGLGLEQGQGMGMGLIIRITALLVPVAVAVAEIPGVDRLVTTIQRLFDGGV